MTTSILIQGALRGVRAVSLLPLDLTGVVLLPAMQPTWLGGLTRASICTVVEPGARVIKAADGVGVIGVDEDDDTLVGIDMDLALPAMALDAVAAVLGGASQYDEAGKVIAWTAPTIEEQRADPKRFEADLYVRLLDGSGFLRYRLFYCRVTTKSIEHSIGSSPEPGFLLSARPHPGTNRVYAETYVAELPAH